MDNYFLDVQEIIGKYMRALVGYGCLFTAVGIIISYFITGFLEFVVTICLLLYAYIMLCKSC